MNEKYIAIAANEATDFLVLANKVLAEVRAMSSPWTFHVSPKLRGALRRKSMDLTRALADMRHSS